MEQSDPTPNRDGHIDFGIVVHQVKLMWLTDRYAVGARSLIAIEAQHCADALICLLEEAPPSKRQTIDQLIDQTKR